MSGAMSMGLSTNNIVLTERSSGPEEGDGPHSKHVMLMTTNQQ